MLEESHGILSKVSLIKPCMDMSLFSHEDRTTKRSRYRKTWSTDITNLLRSCPSLQASPWTLESAAQSQLFAALLGAVDFFSRYTNAGGGSSLAGLPAHSFSYSPGFNWPCSGYSSFDLFLSEIGRAHV